MLKSMHVYYHMGTIVRTHGQSSPPPTASEGIARMHLDHQPTYLASFFVGQCYEIVETINVHFKWKNCIIVGLTKELSGIPPSLCFKLFT